MNLLHRLLDLLIPARVIIRRLQGDIQIQRECLDVRDRTIRIQADEIQALRDELSMTRRERDTAQRQFNETRAVNHHNAAATRAAEVALLRAGHEIERLQLGGKAVPVPALTVPKSIPVPDRHAIPDNIEPKGTP